MKDLIAALLLFTRLPLGGICKLEHERFGRAIYYWPLVGWVTGGFAALLFWSCSQLWPPAVAVTLTILGKILLTGALHEDGLADVCDGLGGGKGHERILAIMKDSHIGVYGVTGLILYFSLLWSCINLLPVEMACGIIVSADVVGKACASFLSKLPYVRTVEESKIGVIYQQIHHVRQWSILIFALLPLCILLDIEVLLFCLIAPAITAGIGVTLFKSKLKGYTGDCCGALFLCCELSFYLLYIAKF